ncbi:MAG: PilZ domain-containing protein [Desulfobacter sp.]|nr:MAG: PilZ domain-containing protein [Desulfobacter sp.]
MNENSIEFQPMPGDNNEDESVRHFFRVPASDKDNILAVFFGQSYSVANVSVSGIAIRADSCLAFESNQEIEDAELLLGTQRITNLTAKVIHCSVHDSGDLQFGMVWLNMANDKRQKLEKILGQMKARALEKDDLPDEQAQ